jgi:hypothetical protein
VANTGTGVGEGVIATVTSFQLRPFGLGISCRIPQDTLFVMPTLVIKGHGRSANLSNACASSYSGRQLGAERDTC